MPPETLSTGNLAAKYFVMNWFTPLRAERYTLEVGYPANDKRWSSGRAFSDTADDEDFRSPTAVIEIGTEAPSGRLPHVYPEFSSEPIPLMTRRLVAALRGAGVSNLQAFETRLVGPLGTPPPPQDHYFAVNIVGRVAAADLKQSTLSPGSTETSISVGFHSLVVDEQRARGALMFRLAENISAVLVHESVKEYVASSGIDTLTWLPPEDWAG